MNAKHFAHGKILGRFKEKDLILPSGQVRIDRKAVDDSSARNREDR